MANLISSIPIFEKNISDIQFSKNGKFLIYKVNNPKNPGVILIDSKSFAVLGKYYKDHINGSFIENNLLLESYASVEVIDLSSISITAHITKQPANVISQFNMNDQLYLSLINSIDHSNLLAVNEDYIEIYKINAQENNAKFIGSLHSNNGFVQPDYSYFIGYQKHNTLTYKVYNLDTMQEISIDRRLSNSNRNTKYFFYNNKFYYANKNRNIEYLDLLTDQIIMLPQVVVSNFNVLFEHNNALYYINEYDELECFDMTLGVIRNTFKNQKYEQVMNIFFNKGNNTLYWLVDNTFINCSFLRSMHLS